MSGVFSGQQWTQASGSTWSVIIEPDFVNAVAELCNHLALSSTEARSNSEQIVTKSQAASGDSGSKEARKEVVKEIIETAGKGVNQGAEAKDIQGFANLAVSLIKETCAESEADSLYTSLANGIAKSPSGESHSTVNARYSALSSIFNSLSESVSSETRSSVLLCLFKLAVEKDNLAILSPALAALPTWLSSEWGIQDTSAADKILSSIVETLEGSSSDDKAEIVRQLLLSYANENTNENLRSKLLLYTLASSSAFDIESLPAVSSNGDLAKVREIFLSGSIADLSSVSSSLPAPLNASKVQEKLQYVLLADYCSSKVGQSISYDEVAKVLGLESSTDEEDRAMEVESWIIATIRVKLLVARLHEPSSTISVLRASPRHFGKEQWSTLQNRLESWQNHMGSILETVGRALGQSGSSSNSRDRHSHDAQHLTQAQHGGSQQQPQQQQTEAAVIEVA